MTKYKDYIIFFILLILPATILFTVNDNNAIAMGGILLCFGLLFAYLNKSYTIHDIKKLF
ncbi:hypothetical protein [Candidatus Marinarcus aquaticus]|uniref:hypothetical protein n=1 Tax=Candidatus Marinarcus aquaticus TaxID=2044504 RepID=UPI00100AE8A1|nr:hypothetical protein [Candidatus Marinarcus aquaticus]